MPVKHKIIVTYTKDLSVEIPDVQTLLLARERISKYKITLDITSKPLKNNSNLYYVVSGCVIVYREEEPNEQLIRFGYEGSFICCLDSFLNNDFVCFGIFFKSETKT